MCNTCSKEIERQGQEATNQRASDRLGGDGQAVALSTRSYYQHQQHPPKLAVRGNQIDIMLVTVEKSQAIVVLVLRCLMVYISSLPLVIRL